MEPKERSTAYEKLIKPRLAEVEKMAETMNEIALANAIGVGKASLSKYKAKHPELKEALDRARKKRGSNYEKLVQPKLIEIAEMNKTMSERQIAYKLGVSLTSFNEYKSLHEELRDALQRGRDELCRTIKEAMVKSAKGYYYTETDESDDGVSNKRRRWAKPDVVAQHLLLKNYDPEWHNDDHETMELKKKQVEIAKQKADDQTW